MISGVPFSGLVGLGGLSNGEANKATGSQAKFYSARAFLRSTFNQDGEKIYLEDEANQIAQTVSTNRVVITAGQFSALDIFDDSRYAKDPRTQFMNWGNLTCLAFAIISASRYPPSIVFRSATVGVVGNSFLNARTPCKPSAKINGVPASSQSTPARIAVCATSIS